MPKGGKCFFTANKKYPFLRKTKIECEVKCEKCGAVFSVANTGNGDIERHLKTKKHIVALGAEISSKSITEFFPSTFDEGMPACEAAWAYHLVQENQSFRSSDCASQLIRTCFKMPKFTCARTKCEAIVVNSLAPYAKSIVEAELDKCNLICISTDASNHGNTKMFPIVVRYFLPTKGVRVRVLDFYAATDERSETITDLVWKTAENYKIKNQIVAYCADNAKINFGGETRGGMNNVFYRMKSQLSHLIGVGCTAHVVHNALKCACDGLPIEMENAAVKKYSHFYI